MKISTHLQYQRIFNVYSAYIYSYFVYLWFHGEHAVAFFAKIFTKNFWRHLEKYSIDHAINNETEKDNRILIKFGKHSNLRSFHYVFSVTSFMWIQLETISFTPRIEDDHNSWQIIASDDDNHKMIAHFFRSVMSCAILWTLKIQFVKINFEYEFWLVVESNVVINGRLRLKWYDSYSNQS